MMDSPAHMGSFLSSHPHHNPPRLTSECRVNLTRKAYPRQPAVTPAVKFLPEFHHDVT